MEMFYKFLAACKRAYDSTIIAKAVRYMIAHPPFTVVLLLMIGLAWNQTNMYYNNYMTEFERLNSGEVEVEEEPEGIQFTQIDENLYTMTGPIEAGDCERIVPDLPAKFTVILESPGGNLAEGSCLAAHFKLRDVVTVVRNDKVYNEDGKLIYHPGLVPELTGSPNKESYGKTMCASACGLLFLAGDKRYLIGDVWFGIHGPGTPPESIGRMNPSALESSAFRTASSLLKLLDNLGVKDEGLKLLFIQIPNHTMYWLKPDDFQAKPALINIATNYKNFWGLTTSHLEAGLN